jgi:hypothetical protein
VVLDDSVGENMQAESRKTVSGITQMLPVLFISSLSLV